MKAFAAIISIIFSASAFACDPASLGYVIAEGAHEGKIVELDQNQIVVEPEAYKHARLIEVETPTYDLFLLTSDGLKIPLTAHCADE